MSYAVVLNLFGCFFYQKLCGSKMPNYFSETVIDVSTNDSINSNTWQVKSSMTGREFTIQRSEVSRIVGNYISQSDIDPTLSDNPILAK